VQVLSCPVPLTASVPNLAADIDDDGGDGSVFDDDSDAFSSDEDEAQYGESP
jgi:hypothetical protein